MKQKIMPPTYFIIFLLVSILLHFIFPIKKLIPFPYNYLGAVLIIFGITINIWADALFKKKKTTVKPHTKPTYLEITGPFRISRHPMYLGMAAILFGTEILYRSIITFIIPILFIVLMEILFIPIEEKNLEKTFEKKYLHYKKKVRRWI